jgi:hypothetical protein
VIKAAFDERGGVVAYPHMRLAAVHKVEEATVVAMR